MKIPPSLRILARVVPGLALLAWLVARFDILDGTVRVDAGTLQAVAIGIGIITLAQAVSSLRWKLIVDVRQVGVGYLFRLYLIGSFFSLALPTSVGGDGVKVLALSGGEGVPVLHASGSVLWDRLSGLIAMLGFCLVAVLLVPEARTVLATLIGPLVAGEGAMAALGLLLALSLIAGAAYAGRTVLKERWSRRREELARSLSFASSWRRTLPVVLGLAVVVQALNIVVWFVLGRSIGLDVGWGYLAFAVPIATLASMIPVSISGLGVREGAWVLLLAPLGVPPSAAIGMSLLFFGVHMGVGCLGGALFLASGLKDPERVQSREGAGT